MAGPLQPLRGARVLDLSRYLPGPFPTRFLAVLRTNMLKIEGPQTGPVRFEHNPPTAPAPALGEHGLKVVRELHIDDQLVRAAIACGALRPGASC